MGYFAFMHGEGGGSKLIRTRKRGWANHVASVRRLGPDERIIEAILGELKTVKVAKNVLSFFTRKPAQHAPTGVVQIRTLAQAAKDNDIRVFQLPALSEPEEDAWWAWERAQIGKGYDEIGIAGFIASSLPFLPFPNAVKVQDERQKSEEFFCSEKCKAGADQRPHAPLLGTLRSRPDPYGTCPPGVYVEPWLVDPEDLMWSPLLTEIAPEVWRPAVGLPA